MDRFGWGVNFPARAGASLEGSTGMAAQSPKAALRDLEAARGRLKKIRTAIRLLRESKSAGPAGSRPAESVIQAGWDALTSTWRLLAGLPFEAVDDEVMLRQISLQRYATALLVRLRRLARGDLGATSDDSEEGDDE
jgi:hypothetical protein